MWARSNVIGILVFASVFAAIAGGGLYLLVWWYRDRLRGIQRLRELGGSAPATIGEAPKLASALATLPRVGELLAPSRSETVGQLRRQLQYAGYYHPAAVNAFLAVKFLCAMSFAILGGLIPFLAGWLSWHRALAGCLGGVALGMFLPHYILYFQTNRRQALLRRGLPDTIDMLVLCLEGGVSLPAAMQRVTRELHWAHPLLAAEMNIIQREIALGMSSGEALQKFGARCGLDEVRDLASVLLQSERFGASIVKALKTHAETARQERQHRAEEKAQKASVKILFPTLLCIFPAVFVVLLGPAAFQIAALFSSMK